MAQVKANDAFTFTHPRPPETAMDLFTIQNDLIARSTADAWFNPKIPGPTFRYSWQYGYSGSDGPVSYITGEHYSHAVHRQHPNLTIAWGLDVEDLHHPRKRRFEWAEQFADTSVDAFWADFFWNGALIDRVELASVDGGHGTIPMPHYGNTVSDYEVAVAVLVHDLNGSQREDHPHRYLRTLGFTQQRDEARHGAGSVDAPSIF